MKNENWRSQKRLGNGRFGTYIDTDRRKYTIDDIRKAFVAGLNNQGGISTNTRKLENYLRGIL
jgi:hypothetical protein